jgi:hypothetical protein
MSTSCGASGVYGILIPSEPKRFPEVAELRTKMEQYLNDGDKNGTWMEKMFNSPSEDPKVKRFRKLFIEAFRKRGIDVPLNAKLHHTGDEDDRPARGGVAADEWVLGFGLYTRPEKYPKLSHSFLKLADWHTWVWLS